MRWLFASIIASILLVVRARRLKTLKPSVLIIGGTGLMGAPTAARLRKEGRRVVVMSRGHEKGQGSSGHRPDFPIGCEQVVCDRSNETAFVAALCAPDCPRIIVDFTSMEPSHILGIQRAHAQTPITHYVFISTNMVYPGGIACMDLSGEQPREEAAQRDAAATAPSNYGGNKLKCEAMLVELAAVEERPLQSTVLRPPAVVGAGCDSRHEKLHRFVAGLPPSLPPPAKRRPAATVVNGRFRVAHAEDVADIVAAVVDRQPASPAEAFNVASGESCGLTLDEYVVHLAQAISDLGPGGPTPRLHVPDDEVDLRNYEKQGAIDTRKAECELCFQPTPIAECVARTVAWHAPLLPTRGGLE